MDELHYQLRDETNEKFENDENLPFLEHEFKGAQSFIKGPFKVVMYSDRMPLQGWKIHLSPTLCDFSKVVSYVDSLCQQTRSAFKFVFSYGKYFLMTSKQLAPSQFGKIITIYPSNRKVFLEFLTSLYQEFSDLTGMDVPSDRSYRESSLIHYRYGGFAPVVVKDKGNELRTKIVDGNGDLVDDIRKSYFQLPAGITDIVDSPSVSAAVETLHGEHTGRKIELSSIIRRLASGNVFMGQVDGKKVVIKEARYGALTTKSYPQGMAIALKANEAKRLLEFAQVEEIEAPTYVDQFHIGRNLFIVESYIEGMSLRKFAKANSLFRPGIQDESQTQFIYQMYEALLQAERLVTIIHRHELVFGDVSADNFILMNNGRLALTDLETVAQPDSELVTVQTPMFCLGLDRTMSPINADFYKLGMSFFWLLTKQNKETNGNLDRVSAELGYLVQKFSKFQPLADEIVKLLTLSRDDMTVGRVKTQHVPDRNFLQESSERVIQSLTRQFLEKLMMRSPEEIPTTDYGQTNLSFLYGMPGFLYTLAEEKNFNDSAKEFWAQYLLGIYMKNPSQMNDGLVFGRAGLAMALAKLDVDFEHNSPLLDLLIGLQDESSSCLRENNVANGTPGVAVALVEIASMEGYPQMGKIIEQLVETINHASIPSEFGLEYGLSGFYLAIKWLSQKGYGLSEELLAAARTRVINLMQSDGVTNGVSTELNNNVRYPNFMFGSAGLFYVALKTKIEHYDVDAFLAGYDAPSMVNNGISVGVAGICLPLLFGIRQGCFNTNQKDVAVHYLRHWVGYLLSHVKKSRGCVEFLADQGIAPKYDLGSGMLGILLVLKQFVGLYDNKGGAK
jgi:serine/threonine protein kinase